MSAEARADDLLRTQSVLQAEAEALRRELGLDALLGEVGELTVVGSAALGLMAWPDLDITVTCDVLDHGPVLAIVDRLGRMPAVREVRFRDDTGHWNTDPDYPDGLYIGVDCVATTGRRWSLDIWFVDEPQRQPDLAHLRDLHPRITDEIRLAILEIKTAWCNRPQYGSTVTSFAIYRAVIDDGVRTLAAFEEWRTDGGGASDEN